jgi:hypothetical protein
MKAGANERDALNRAVLRLGPAGTLHEEFERSERSCRRAKDR